MGGSQRFGGILEPGPTLDRANSPKRTMSLGRFAFLLQAEKSSCRSPGIEICSYRALVSTSRTIAGFAYDPSDGPRKRTRSPPSRQFAAPHVRLVFL